jgi:hypothetical protein
MRNIFSDMLRLTEEFLVAEDSRSNKLDIHMFLMAEYSKRKLIKLYEKNLDKTESILGNGQLHDVDYYKNNLRFEQLKKTHEIIHKDIYINPKNREQQISDTVTIIFLMEILFRNLQLINVQKKYDFNYRLNFEEEIDHFLNNGGGRYLEIPYIKYYYYTFKLLKTHEEKYYLLLKEFVSPDVIGLSKQELRDIYLSLINYCYIRITNGEDNFIKELFSLNIRMIDKGIFTTAAGNIPNVFFMNAVTTGLESGEAVWVERFITEKGELLKDDSKTDTLHFCNAQLSFFKKDYNSALNELSKVSTDDMTYKLNTKSLYLKLYFDLNDIEPFLSHVDSYKHFVANNRLVFDQIKDPVNNYITFAKRIFCIKNGIGKFDEYNLPVLKREIIECFPLINRPWLLRKIEEVK